MASVIFVQLLNTKSYDVLDQVLFLSIIDTFTQEKSGNHFGMKYTHVFRIWGAQKIHNKTYIYTENECPYILQRYGTNKRGFPAKFAIDNECKTGYIHKS